MTKQEFFDLLEECAGRNGWHTYRPTGYDPHGQGAGMVVSSQGCHQREYTLADLDQEILTPFAGEIHAAGLSCVLQHDDAGHCVLRVFEIRDRGPRREYTMDEIENRPIE